MNFIVMYMDGIGALEFGPQINKKYISPVNVAKFWWFEL